jgi:uroporphyrinogen-III synthase
MPFDGLRVLSLESRRAAEIEKLIRAQGGDPFVVPSMREAPLDDSPQAFAFAERLFRGEFDMMIFLTGVGTRALHKLLATRYPAERFAEALRSLAVVARGPKPVAALREMNVPVTISAPEPNTWREVMAATETRPERRIAVQEYGRPNPDLLQALRARGAEVTPVRIYQFDLPEDTAPLRQAAEQLAAGDLQVALFTTAVQIDHLMRVAKQAGLEDFVQDAFARMVVGSIGPTTSEALEEYGIRPDLEPSHPRMGLLVHETAARAGEILKGKR